jgi:succinate dehydrogenase / fumarate reductase membrane anchor subunit
MKRSRALESGTMKSDMRTPLGRVLGYGSAKSGTGHFIEQRLTALANVPLTIAAVLIVISLIGHNHAAVVQILGSSPVAIIMLLFIISTVYHMKIGMQVIIEDYVHDDGAKFALLIANAFFAIVVGFSSVYAILKLSFGV